MVCQPDLQRLLLQFSEPRGVALAVGTVTTYWSWCLAMYRDVEYGRGILEAVIQVTLAGPRLPWLTTVQRMGYVPAGFVVWVLLSALAGVWRTMPPP